MKATTRLLCSRRGSCRILAACLVAALFPSGLSAQGGAATPVYRWTTLAGRATTGSDDGAAAEARFNNPHGAALDAGGNVYVADTANHTIRRISLQGAVTTFAGSAGQPGGTDGSGGSARFLLPQGLAADSTGNLYVADTGNYTIRKISPDGVVTTLAGQAGQPGDVDGAPTAARFGIIRGITADSLGNVYVNDGRFRRIFAAGVEPLTLATQMTTGGGRTVNITSTGQMAVTADGQIFFAARAVPIDGAPYSGSKRIMKRDAAGVYSVLASGDSSDGKPFVSDQTSEVAMTTDGAGNLYFVTQLVSSIIEYSLHKISPDGTMSRPLWAGLARGGFSDAPLGLAADATERIIHTIAADDVILQNTPQTFTVLAGTPWSNRGVDGTGGAARFSNIAALALDRNGQVLVADSQSQYNVHFTGGAELRKISPAGATTTLYSGPLTQSPPQASSGVAMGAADNILLGIYTGQAEFRQITPNGAASPLTRGSFQLMNAMAADSTGQLFVADRQRRVHRRTVDGQWSIFAGADQAAEIKDGQGGDARFAEILGLSAAASGDVYALDRLATPELRVVIRRIQPTGQVTTVGPNLAKAADISPVALAIDAKGDFLLTYGDNTVRLLSAAGGEFIVGGASLQSGVRDGDGQVARFYQSGAITTDALNTVFVADNTGVTVRKGEFLGYNASILSHPQSITVAAGASAQFSVTASGTPAPTYQWQYNGTPLNGATGSTLTLTNVTATQAGSYAVVVTNSLGSIASNSATLTVTSVSTPPPTPPPAPPSTPPSGGGGGAPSAWFLLALASLGAVRRMAQRQVTPAD